MIRSKGDQALFQMNTMQMKRRLGVPTNIPENIPASEDVKKVECRIESEKKKALGNKS